MDEMLNALTNRSGGFCTPEFPQRSNYVPREQNSTQVAVRDLLGLSRQDTDYFVHACLSILATQPDLAVLFDEQERSYDLQLYRPYPPQIHSAVLEHDNGIPGGVLRRAVEWPVQFDMTLTRIDDTSALLALPGSQEELLTIQTVDDRLRLNWPDWSGITGLLTPSRAWEAPAVMHFHHEPVRFPFKALRGALGNSESAMYLLSNAGILEAFLNTQSPLRACALGVTALGLSNL